MKPTFGMNNKKAIFFDLQDTLVSPKAAFVRGLEATLNEFTARWMSDIEPTHWKPADSANKYKKECRGLRASQRTDALRVALSESPFPVTDAFLNRVWMRAKELTPQYAQVYPHVYDTLMRLQPLYQFAIISNTPRYRLEEIVASSGLGSLFPPKHIFLSEDIHKKKPNPALFDKALKTLGIKPSNAVMVGNSWKNDVQGAVQSRIDAVWLHKNSKKTVRRRLGGNRVIIISRFGKLLELFEHEAEQH
jgi:putative hydrolase of the HAD superfamily